MYVFFFAVNNEVLGNCSTPYETGCILKDLSCRLTSFINVNKTFEYKYYDTENEAIIAAKTGEVWGYVYFHENFTTAFVARMSNAVGVDGLTRNQSTAQVRYFIFREINCLTNVAF